MAALAANAVKSQRRKAANKLAEQALSNINEQRQFLATVAQKHRDSLSSVSTLDSYRQYEVKKIFAVVWKYKSEKKFAFSVTFFYTTHYAKSSILVPKLGFDKIYSNFLISVKLDPP